MITGLSYLGAMVCLAVLLKFAANERHESAAGREIFRYPAVLLWVIFFGSPLYALVGVLAYVTSTKPIGMGMFGFVALAVLANSYAYIYFKKYYVEVTGDAILVGGLKKKTVPFLAIRKIILIEGGKGGMQMRLLNERNESLEPISKSRMKHNCL